MFSQVLVMLFSFVGPFLGLIIVAFLSICLGLLVFKVVAFVMDVLPFI